jgi:[acyl-carrier-protein] S-malonyltransferase
LETPDEIRNELVGQLTGSVQWTNSIFKMQELGAARYVEIGPGDVLAGLVRRIPPGLNANVRTIDDFVAL